MILLPQSHFRARLLCATTLAAWLATAYWLAAPALAEPPQVKGVSLVIGSLLPSEGEPAPAPKSPLHRPFGVAFDSEGAMFIVELEGGRVHERGKDGQVRTIAGDGSRGYRGDGGSARDATFNGMHNLAISRAGKLYISDTWNHCVREIDLATRRIATVAGTGESGFSGDGGPARQATFFDIMCVSLHPAEDALLLTDLKNRRVRRMNLDDGTVVTVAGNGQRGVPSDGAPATQSPLVDPRAAVVDSQGRLYVLERSGHALRRVDLDGRIVTVAGTGQQGRRDGPALQAQFGAPKHLCVDAQDRVYIADDTNAAIRCYDPATETVITLLGRGAGDERIRLKNPHGVCIHNGQLYVVDTGNDRVFVVTFEG